MKFVKLGKVAKIDRTVATSYECQTLPYVGLEHIEKDKGNFSTEFERKSETLLATKFKFTPKHVLYGKLRPYLNKVALPGFEGVCTTEILPILPFEDKLDRTYLWGLLLTPRFVAWASRVVSGANLPRLSPSDLSEFEVPLPPLPEQKRLAAILAKADRLRRLRRYTLEVSDTYLQTVFLEMFGDPAINPKGWDVKTLAELKAKFAYGTSEKSHSEPVGLPVLRIPNVLSGKLNLNDLKYSDLSEKEAARSILQRGDIIFVRTNGNPNYVGRCAVFDLEERFLYASYLIRARVNENLLDPWYLTAFLRTQRGREAMGPFIRTTAGQSNLGMEGLGQIPVPVPSLVLQQKFAQIVQRHERLRLQQREAARQAEGLFGALLHRAFRGELSAEAALV